MRVSHYGEHTAGGHGFSLDSFVLKLENKTVILCYNKPKT